MISFQPVKSGKVSELIAQQIRSAIRNGIIKSGERLPPERELVKRFQASRISVREALKGLETSGLITIKPGSGAFVAEMDTKAISEPLSSILRIQRTPLKEITEARLILEPTIAKLATEKMTSESIQQLEQNIQNALKKVKSHSPSTVENIGFHSLLASATQNRVISLTIKTLLDVTEEMTLEIKNNLSKRVEISKYAILFHKRILEAIKAKDSQKVYQLMQKHVYQIYEGFKRIKKD